MGKKKVVVEEKKIHFNVINRALTKTLNYFKYKKNKVEQNENLTVKGTLRIYELDKKGNKVLKLEKQNLILNTGLNFDMKRRYTNAVNPLTHLQLGDDDTLPSPTQTALGNQIYRAEAQFTDTSNSLKALIFVPAGVATGNWKEAGLDNGSILYNRITFDYIKGEGVSTYVEFTILENNKVV